MRICNAICACFIFILLSTGSAFAADSDFTIETLVGSDTTPPSAPSGLTATAVAFSQIDLAWSSSTDNVGVSGYQVFRDGVQVATTTNVNYSDSGLSASTNYSYYVTAFDPSDNVSASSSVVSATTLANITTATTSSGGGGSSPKIELDEKKAQLTSLEIVPGKTSVELIYRTEGMVRSVVRWGESTAYELGSLQEQLFTRDHNVVINDLRPDTTYQFTIEGENGSGASTVLTTGTFTTLPPEDTFAPGNVTRLTAMVQGSDILLDWRNPTDSDFSHVRVLRSNTFYPSDTADGWFVYEGSGTQVLDTEAAAGSGTQFYTVFSYDERGNVSSGAVVAVSIGGAGERPTDAVKKPEGSGADGAGSTDTEQATGTETVSDDPRDVISISFADIVFIQVGEQLEPEGDVVEVDGTKRLQVAIPYARLPEHLKTIVMELNRPDGSGTDSFLLRVDEDREYYTTTLAPFTVEGRFPVTLSIYDFETSQIGSVSGEIVSTIAYIPQEQKEQTFFGYIGSLIDADPVTFSIYTSFVILLLILLVIASRRFIH